MFFKKKDKDEELFNRYCKMLEDTSKEFYSLDELGGSVEDLESAYYKFIDSIVEKDGYISRKTYDAIANSTYSISRCRSKDEANRLNELRDYAFNKENRNDPEFTKKFEEYTLELYKNTDKDYLEAITGYAAKAHNEAVNKLCHRLGIPYGEVVKKFPDMWQ